MHGVAWSHQVVQVNDAHRGVMVTTSLGVILFTTVFFGAVMPFFTRGLKPEQVALPPKTSWFEYSEWPRGALSLFPKVVSSAASPWFLSVARGVFRWGPIFGAGRRHAHFRLRAEA